MAGLVYLDAETWRYENAGTSTLLKVTANDLTNLPVTKSKTRIAFWQNQYAGIFDIPAERDIWIKFDMYYGGADWRIYSGTGYGTNGVGIEDGEVAFYLEGSVIRWAPISDIISRGEVKTFLLHLSLDEEGLAEELWIDGVKYSREENIYVRDTENFGDLYFQSDDSTTFFSNVIISNRRIGLGENVLGYNLTQAATFDTERQLETIGTIVKPKFDTERRIATGINREACLTFPSGAIILDAPTPNGAAVFTIEVAVATTSENGVIVCYPAAGKYIDFDIYLSSGEPCVYYKADGALATGLSGGKIHRIAVVSYEDQSAEMYLDGVSVEHLDGRGFYLSSVDFKVGSSQINFYELRIWSTARTAEEIFSRIRGDEEGLVAWYLPEEGGLRDHSVNLRTTRNEDGTPIYSATFPPQKFDLEWIFKAPFPVSATFDVQREVVRYWRYYNLGSEIYLLTQGTRIDNLPADKSKTGIAFYQTAKEKCFDIPASNDLWIKFDVYTTDLATRWRAFCTGDCLFGVRSYDDGALGVFVYKTSTQLLVYDVIKEGELQTILMHITGASVEVWVDGGGSNSYQNGRGSAKLWIDGDYSYNRDTDNTIYFASLGDFYLQSDGENTFFSNVIISDRQIGFDEGAQRFTCETERTIGVSGDLTADLVREVLAPVRILKAVDLQRVVCKQTVFNADIAALLINKLEFDTERLPLRYELFHCDLKRQLPHKLTITPIDVPEQIDTTGVQSISIDLAAQQLTDQLSFTWIHPAEIMQQIRGQYLDYKFDMRVEDITEIGVLRTCHCCSDIDELLYTQAQIGIKIPSVPMTTEEAEIWRALENAWYLEYFGVPKYLDDVDSEILSQIQTILSSAAKKFEVLAKIFGKCWVVQFEDFSSTVFFGRGVAYTFGDMIRELFGWTSRVPNLLINCYLRGDTLYAVQRGHEANVIDLTGTKHTMPVVRKNLMRLAWGSDADSYTITATEPVYTPDEELEADNAAQNAPMTDEAITNKYDDDNLVTQTTIRDEETTTVIDYEYTTTASGRKLLVREITKVTDNDTGDTVEEREVIHEPLADSRSGQGLSVARDEDGETTASVVGQKPFTDKPTPWAKHVHMNGKWYTLTGEQEKEVTINGHALVDTSLPVTDFATKKNFSDAINWLNRKTQETISMDVYDFPHVIDFNDRIIFNGAEYFLESNTVTKTPRIVNKQSVRFVRWY